MKHGDGAPTSQADGLSPAFARGRSIVGIGLGAPITAEFLQTYLPSTGDAVATVGAVAFLAPVYGGAALLIREVAVRMRLGWSGILLLGAAFGVVMSGIIDLSLFGTDRPEISYWSDLREPTEVGALGISGYTTMTWVVGHAVMSIGAPLAVHQALAPSVRDTPLLGRWGLAATVLSAGACAALIHLDGREIYGYSPSVPQVVGVLAVAAALTVAAMSPLGRPRNGRPRSGHVRATAVFGGALVAKVAFELVPFTWVGVGAGTAILVAAGLTVRRLATTTTWTSREIGMLGAAVIVGGVLIGFLNPIPTGVSTASKVIQNVIALLLSLVLAAMVARRSSTQRA